MNNPFFVLYTDENEFIGIIRNPLKSLSKEEIESFKDVIYDKLTQSVVTCLEHHYDVQCSNIEIPKDFADWHKPVDITAYMGDDQNAFTKPCTLTMAWDY